MIYVDNENLSDVIVSKEPHGFWVRANTINCEIHGALINTFLNNQDDVIRFLQWVDSILLRAGEIDSECYVYDATAKVKTK